MTNRKTQNSILVLATLGVYLGLVLAGATPQIIAQTTGKRDLRAELIGKYPCPNSLINGETDKDIHPFEFDLANHLRELAEATKVRLEIVRANEPGKNFSLPFFYRQVDYAPYFVRGKKEEYEWNQHGSKWASAAHAGQIAELHSHFLTPLADCNGLETKRLSLASSAFRMDEGGVRLNLFVRRSSILRANSLADSLNTLFSEQAKAVSEPNKSVYDNTKALARGRVVFIVTRLPRAGLDSLLATDAK